MSLTRKNLINSGTYNVFGNFFPILVYLVFTPYLVIEFGKEIYGLWVICLSTIGISGLFNFGLETGLIKFLSEYDAHHEAVGLRSSISISLLMNTLVGFMGIFAIWILSPWLSSLINADGAHHHLTVYSLRAVSICILPLQYRSTFLAVLKSRLRYKWPSIIISLQSFLVTAGAALLLLMDLDFLVILLWSDIVIICTSIFAYFLARPILIEWNFRPTFSKKYVKSILSFSSYAGMTTLGTRIFNQLDRFIIGATLGLDAVTYYSVPISVANKILVLSSSGSQVLLPYFSKSVASAKHPKYYMRILASIFINNYSSVLIGMILFLFSGSLLSIWISREFSQTATPLLKIFIIAYAIISFNTVPFHVLTALRQPQKVFLVTLLSGVISLSLIYFLSLRFGLFGAAMGNLGYLFSVVLVFQCLVTIGMNNLKIVFLLIFLPVLWFMAMSFGSYLDLNVFFLYPVIFITFFGIIVQISRKLFPLSLDRTLREVRLK